MRHYIVIRTLDHKYLQPCVDSIGEQGVPGHTDVHYDGVTDVEIPFRADDTVCVYEHEDALGVAGNLYRGLEIGRGDAMDTDIIAILDGDDLLPPKALWRVQRVYEKYPETLVTYGSYIKMSKGRKTKISQPYPDGADVRTYPWRGSHLKTFRASLLPHIREEWFKDEKGNWLQAASDLALMIPLMELAGLDRCRHISRPTYIWRDNTPWKTNRELQKRCEAIVRAKPREKRLP